MDHPTRRVDVLVVGGGPAGLSAALMLGRSRRSVLVIDAAEPRNAPAAAVHGFLGRDGTPPGELLAERWGRDVIHCPYCHEWEVRDNAIGVLATSPMSWHQAGLFRQLSDRVVVLRHTTADVDPDVSAGLAARGVRFVDGEVVRVEVDGDAVSGVRLADGRVVPLEVLVVTPRSVGRADRLDGLGLALVEHPAGVGAHVPADPMGRSDATGVWVAGNVTDPSAQVITAAAQGARAGAAINADLVTEDTARARRDA